MPRVSNHGERLATLEAKLYSVCKDIGEIKDAHKEATKTSRNERYAILLMLVSLLAKQFLGI